MDFVLSILPNVLVHLFKSAMNIFRVFKLKVNLIECRLDGLRSSDGEGGFVGGSHAHFRIEIINSVLYHILFSGGKGVMFLLTQK